MKKILALMLAAALALSLVACGGGTGDTNTPGTGDRSTTNTDTSSGGEDRTPTEEDTQTKDEYYKVGDTVSTDIVSFALDSAELAIALSNIRDESYCVPKEYNAQEDADNPLVSAKGHTFAAFTYTITNLDRTSYAGELPFVSAKYKNEISSKQVDGAEYNKEKDTWETTGNTPVRPIYSWRFVVPVGEEKSFRSYIDLPVEADSLTDEFHIIVELPVSDGTTSTFTYLVAQ